MIHVIRKTTRFSVFGKAIFRITRTTRRFDASPALARDSGTPTQETEQPAQFVVNSLFLDDCMRLLTRTDDEGLHVVTGSMLGNLHMLERIVPLRLSQQSVAGARADDQSLAGELIRLNEFGLLPLGYFHSHPGCGAASTVPSATDRHTQDRFEAAGAEVVGGIFSRDGFVRFYRNKEEPKVVVLGRKVKEVGDNVFQIETEDA